MQQYNVDCIYARRVNPDEGTIEYHVHWGGYDAACDTWEPRANLLPHCASLLAPVDDAAAALEAQRVAAWATGATGAGQGATGATGATGAIGAEGAGQGATGAHSAQAALLVRAASLEAQLLALGPRVLGDAAARALNPAGRRGGGGGGPSRAQKAQRGTRRLCDPARRLEGRWREQHGVSLMRTCAAATRRTRAAAEFVLSGSGSGGGGGDVCRDAGDIAIRGIAPALLVRSAGSAAQRRAQQEPLVVRYVLLSQAAGDGEEGEEAEGNRPLHSMPLSVFRKHYPQLLLDYLLHHSLVFESE